MDIIDLSQTNLQETQMFQCLICNKEFKRNQDLKTHNTKNHKLDNSVVNDTLSESEIPQYNYQSSINQNTQQDTYEENELSFDLSSESSAVEQVFADSVEIQQHFDFACQTEVQTNEIGCQYEEQIVEIPKHRSGLKINGIFEQSTISKLDELPAVVDDIKLFNGKLQVLIDQITYDISHLPVFRQYKPIEVDPFNRVQLMRDIDYTLVSYKNYKPDSIDKPSFLNMRLDNRQGNQLPALLAKLKNETGLKCRMKTPLQCYFDMETFDTDLDFNDCPTSNRQTSHVSMISLVYAQTAILFHLKLYRFDIQTAQKTIFEHCGKQYTIQTQPAENENAMMLMFIMQLKQLSEQRTVILAGFNSSCDKKDEGRLGYDCSFLLRNLRSTIKVETRRCTGSGEFPKQLVQIGLLPNVYFCDMLLLYDENTKTQKKDIQGFSLNAYLKYYGVPTKMDGDHKQQRQVQICGGNINDYGTYCLYDSICLQLVGDKRKIIDQRLSYCSQFQIPLSVALYQTPVNMLISHLMTEYYNAGYMFTYSKMSKYEEKRLKQGAFAGSCPKELQLTVLKHAHIFDFASQYPNVGIQNNISPETYSSEYKDGFHRVQINYQVDQPDDLPEEQKIYAYFDNTKLGIISEFQKHTFDERLATKQQQKQYKDDPIQWQILEIKQLALKEMINSMYGAQNDERGQLYRYECGSAITGGARTVLDQSIKLAEQIFNTKRLFADTDSLAIQYSGSDVKDRFKTLKSTVLSTNPRMELEFEKSYKAIIYPANKKSYANVDQKDVLTTKGLGYNKFTLQYRNRLCDLFRQILTNTTIKTPIELAKQYMIDLTIELKQIVDSKRIDLLQEFINIRKHTKKQNKLGSVLLSGYLQQTHTDIDQFNTIPFNCHIKRNFCHMPIEKITPDNINQVRVNDLIADLCQPLKTFFKIDLPKSQTYMGQEVQTNEIMVRIETSRFQDKRILKPDELETMIKQDGNHKAFHEVITTDTCKMYFDIEHETIRVSAYKLSQVIQDVLQNYNVRIHIADGSKPNKMSYHVVVEIKCNKQTNRFICGLINVRLGKVCDLAVYSHNHTIRLPNCIKIDDERKIEPRKLKPITGSQFKDFLITGSTDGMPDYTDYISFDNICPISDAKQFNSTANPESVNELLKKHNITGKIKGKNQIVISKKPYNCPACNNEQRSDNLRISGDRVLCYDEGCCGIQVASVKSNPKAKQLKNADIQNQYKVKYDLFNAHHTFVKSQMGTAKTETLLQLIQNDYQNIVVVSFRRTFADEFSTKMGFVNYQTCNGADIRLSDHKRICIQYESLHKLDLDCCVDLVVFDEIESIWSQVMAFEKRENNQNKRKLTELLSNKCLIMDALLQQSTIKLVGKISQIDNVQIYENVFKMQSDRQMFVNTNPRDVDILKEIRQDLDSGKNISINCCSKRLAREIRQLGLDLGLPVALYDGDNNKVIDQFGKLQTMGSHKKQQLANPNDYWTQVRLLIYTATISAGVSFTQKHFNVQYGILKNKSSDVVAFVQGNHRVRDLADQTHKIYIFPLHHDDYKTTPLRISKSQNSFNPRSVYIRNNQIQQLDIFIQARANTLRQHAKELFLMWSEQNGYQITIDGESVSNEEVKLPDHIQSEPIVQEFTFTEDEFNKLPHQMKMNDFSLTHNDIYMESKIQIVSLASIYNKNYKDIMTLYDARDLTEDSDWSKLIKYREHKLRLNLAEIALNKTKITQFDEAHYKQIEQELLEYLDHTRRHISQITSNLNITTDFQKTKFIETFIIGIRTYDQIKQLLQSPDIGAELLKLGKKTENAVKLLNNRVNCLGYQFKSVATKTNVIVDGKRTSQRTYTYQLLKVQIEEQDQKYLQ